MYVVSHTILILWSWKKLPSLLLRHCIYGANRWDKQCTECELCTHCIHPNKDSKHVTSPQPVQWAAGSGGLVQNGENQGWSRSHRHRGRWTVWTLGVTVCWIMMQNVDSFNWTCPFVSSSLKQKRKLARIKRFRWWQTRRMTCCYQTGHHSHPYSFCLYPRILFDQVIWQ